MKRKKENIYFQPAGRSLFGGVLFCLIWLVQTPNYAQQLRFSHLTIENGLSQNSITAICQDKRGFVWLGTYNGLNKYDGHSFKVYRSVPGDSTSLGDNFILVLFKDSAGDLWVGTYAGGLHKYDYLNDAFIPIDVRMEKGIIRAITQDPNDKLWVATSKGLLKMDLQGQVLTVFQGEVFEGIYSLDKDWNEHIWAGTENGTLLRIHPVHHTIQTVKLEKNSASVKTVNCVYPDSLGRVWAGTNHGLFFYDQVQKEVIQKKLKFEDDPSLEFNEVRSFWYRGDQQLWVTTTAGGLVLLDLMSGQTSHIYHEKKNKFGLNKNALSCIYEDEAENIWVGTFDKGINLSVKNQKPFYSFFEQYSEAPPNSVLALLEDRNGDVWIGTDENGLFHYAAKTNKTTHYHSESDTPHKLRHKVVTTLADDNFGNIWVGYSSHGIDVISKNGSVRKESSFTRLSEMTDTGVKNIYKDSQGRMWIGTNGAGILVYDPISAKTFRYQAAEGDSESLSNNYINDILEDIFGFFWIATWEGLNRYDPKTGNFERYLYSKDEQGTISNNVIIELYQDSKSNLWVGTLNGLNKYDREKDSFLPFFEVDGLPNNTICGILEDDSGNLWISTYKGISMYNVSEGTFRNFHAHDGLQGNQFNYGAAAKGRYSDYLYFGGLNGINFFDPKEIHVNTTVPRTQLLSLDILKNGTTVTDNRIVSYANRLDSSITLHSDESTFSIEFVGITFTAQDKCSYRYLLEGYDESWVDNGTKKMVKYTKVPTGKYTFKVRSSNSDGIWDQEASFVNIEILPPFWETFWFKFLVFFGISSAILIIHYMRVRTIKAQKRKLESIVTTRTSEVVAQREEIRQQAESLRKANKDIIQKNLHLEQQKEEIAHQAERIRRMNDLLKIKNVNLKHDVIEISRARVMQKKVSFEEFKRIYPDNEACIELLRDLKKDDEFHCVKCDSDEYYLQSGAYFRRCRSCGYREPVSYGTIFYRLRFPIVKAFYILYLVSTGKCLTMDELSDLLELRRQTCWSFKKKVEKLISQKKHVKDHSESWKEYILVPSEELEEKEY